MQEQWQFLWKKLRIFGAVLSPFDAFLLERGVKTLPLRMEKHSSNALKIAKYLENNTKFVEKVYYPGLESHAQHEIAKSQMKNGFGGMISFVVKGIIIKLVLKVSPLY
jgi:methionine-gamma-lyase